MKNETKIKICGLTRPEDIDYVNEMNPDYVGFVFWPNSKRAVNIAQAVELRQKLRSDIKAVGVFVNEDTDIVIELLNNRIIDLAQLHGSETEKQIHDIRCETGKPVIKAVKIKSEEDILNWLDTEADYLLLDSGMGSGETFDWDILQRISGIGKPFFLAGGLDPDNVAEAVSCVHPFAVDVSSGVETDGVKDKEKIQKFIRRVRNEQR
ncbi:MAG: phosphoribosylanthranilate isomerase [Lachnospiraceae bacterium]|nr:phosphoribosylanthranilate isomerase [Lachnospiraceae bacterium]